MQNIAQILVYFTAFPQRVVGGAALCLHIEDDAQREQMLLEMARTLQAGVVRLPGGDAMLIAGI